MGERERPRERIKRRCTSQSNKQTSISTPSSFLLLSPFSTRQLRPRRPPARRHGRPRICIDPAGELERSEGSLSEGREKRKEAHPRSVFFQSLFVRSRPSDRNGLSPARGGSSVSRGLSLLSRQKKMSFLPLTHQNQTNASRRDASFKDPKGVDR